MSRGAQIQKQMFWPSHQQLPQSSSPKVSSAHPNPLQSPTPPLSSSPSLQKTWVWNILETTHKNPESTAKIELITNTNLTKPPQETQDRLSLLFSSKGLGLAVDWRSEWCRTDPAQIHWARLVIESNWDLRPPYPYLHFFWTSNHVFYFKESLEIV